MNREVALILVTKEDVTLLQEIKRSAFLPLYEKYQDHETSPVNEPNEKIVKMIEMEKSEYYFIKFQEEYVGGVRVVERQNRVFSIGPIFILPGFQNQGIGLATMEKIFSSYPQGIMWRLNTILQEKGNCKFYETCGFLQTGKEKVLNERMTLIDYEKPNLTIRRFVESDAEAVTNLIQRNFKEVNRKDYGDEAIDELVRTHDLEWVLRIASASNMYVFCKEEEILAVGSIASFWGSKTESILLTIFVLPEHHGKGIGRVIIRTLEQDELFQRANRVEIPASITAVDFYRKFGYEFKNGVKKLDENNLFRLEKFK